MYINISYKFHRILDTQSHFITKVHDLLGQPSYNSIFLLYIIAEYVYTYDAPPPYPGIDPNTQAYPPPQYPPQTGGQYPPPAGGQYPPPAGGQYPPQTGGQYPPQANGYAPGPANNSTSKFYLSCLLFGQIFLSK